MRGKEAYQDSIIAGRSIHTMASIIGAIADACIGNKMPLFSDVN